MKVSYEKILTANDIGATGSHQAGIVVPKTNKGLLEFFPSLETEAFNPDAWITCIDVDGVEWTMRFVYYNGKTFSPPKSTRNEYRLTYMTRFFSNWGARAGDAVVFKSTNKPNTYMISIRRKEESSVSGPIVLKGWNSVF